LANVFKSAVDLQPAIIVFKEVFAALMKHLSSTFQETHSRREPAEWHYRHDQKQNAWKHARSVPKRRVKAELREQQPLPTDDAAAQAAIEADPRPERPTPPGDLIDYEHMRQSQRHDDDVQRKQANSATADNWTIEHAFLRLKHRKEQKSPIPDLISKLCDLFIFFHQTAAIAPPLPFRRILDVQFLASFLYSVFVPSQFIKRD
jgi:hypothetical protein